MKYTFLTEKFKSSGFETLEVFNELLKKKLIVDQDMYTSGEYLTAGIKEDNEALALLSTLVSNVEAYKAVNVKRGYSPLSLNALHEMHLAEFGGEWEIMWDHERYDFDLRCVLENDEEDE